MKTVSEMKRLKAGQRLRLVYHFLGVKDFMREREIKRVQSNALTLWTVKPDGNASESWLYFPKACDFEGTGRGFKILENGKVLLEYEVIE